jgi:hypothetical protein
MVEPQLSLSQALEGYFVAAHARRLSSHTLLDYDSTFRRFQQFSGQDPSFVSLPAGRLDLLFLPAACYFLVRGNLIDYRENHALDTARKTGSARICNNSPGGRKIFNGPPLLPGPRDVIMFCVP